MKFVFPDSMDQVDPSFDFLAETRSDERVRQRDDRYAHELFTVTPYDGMLVSKAIVDGVGESSSAKYTVAQRQRLLRDGVRAFFRLEKSPLFFMGDCGAFSYVKEAVPPFAVNEVVEFYDTCGFDFGISVDHIILPYDASFDEGLGGLNVAPVAWRERQQITLALAEEFHTLSSKGKVRFHPIGVAQGWSPKSYAYAVSALQAMGYRYIALGGLVPLKTKDILAALSAAHEIAHPDTRFHLLGVTRLEELQRFEELGAYSFDSTSPLRQAFKDQKNNYHTLTRRYSALRVPQVDGNPKLRKRIASGEIDGNVARRLEQQCLGLLAAYDGPGAPMAEVLEALLDYEKLHDSAADRRALYQEVLEDRPWKNCACDLCNAIGIHMVIFRGAERNRRRGFHNLYVLHQRLTAHRNASTRQHTSASPQAAQ